MKAALGSWIALSLVWGAAFGAIHLIYEEPTPVAAVTEILIKPSAVAGNDLYEERGLFLVDETEFDSFAPAPRQSNGAPLF